MRAERIRELGSIRRREAGRWPTRDGLYIVLLRRRGTWLPLETQGASCDTEDAHRRTTRLPLSGRPRLLSGECDDPFAFPD